MKEAIIIVAIYLLSVILSTAGILNAISEGKLWEAFKEDTKNLFKKH